MTLEIPARLRTVWPLHRVATSGYYHDSFADISERWGLAELYDALELLDAFADAKPAGGE